MPNKIPTDDQGDGVSFILTCITLPNNILLQRSFAEFDKTKTPRNVLRGETQYELTNRKTNSYYR
jgi:hypothetical protein